MRGTRGPVGRLPPLQADRVSFCFAGGETRLVPGSYIEFAERLPLPQFAHLKVGGRGCWVWRAFPPLALPGVAQLRAAKLVGWRALPVRPAGCGAAGVLHPASPVSSQDGTAHPVVPLLPSPWCSRKRWGRSTGATALKRPRRTRFSSPRRWRWISRSEERLAAARRVVQAAMVDPSNAAAAGRPACTGLDELCTFFSCCHGGRLCLCANPLPAYACTCLHCCPASKQASVYNITGGTDGRQIRIAGRWGGVRHE